MTNLVLKPHWTLGGQQGCCGIGSVSRLNSSSCTESARRENLISWANTKDPFPLMSDRPQWQSADLRMIFEYLSQRPQGVLWHGRESTVRWFGGAVLSDYAFCAVLEQMNSFAHAIWFFSDNVDGVGDVHTGPFSTRAFVNWLFYQQIGAIKDTGPVKSNRTQCNIQGWMFTPNYEYVQKIITKMRAELIAEIKEINDDPKIKGACENREAARVKHNAELSKNLGDHWGSYAYE